MTTFAAASDAYFGEQPIVLVELVVGGTTYRWSTIDLHDTVSGAFYEGRIVRAGDLDRQMASEVPPVTDLRFTLHNLDDGAGDNLDALLEDFATFSMVASTITIKRGYQSVSLADFEEVAVVSYAAVRRVTTDRLIELEVKDDPTRQFGEIVAAPAQDVYDALTVADAATWPADSDIKGGDAPVPVVLGRYEMNGRHDGVDARTEHFDHGGALGGQTFAGQVRFVALSPNDFDTSRLRLRAVDDAGELTKLGDGEYDSPNQLVTWDTISITLNGGGWFVLIVKFQNALDRTGDWAFPAFMLSTWRMNVEPYAPGRFVPTPWRVAEYVRGAAEAGDDYSAWATQADTASWDKIDEHAGTRVRRIIYETTPVATVIGEALAQCRVDAYTARDGLFTASWIEPPGGPSPDFSSKLLFSEIDDFLSMEAEQPERGRWSMANVINAHFAERAIAGPELLQRVAMARRNRTDSGLILAPDAITVENAASITRHNGHRQSANVGGSLIYVRADAVRIAERERDIRPDPVWVVTVDTAWRGARLELAQIIRVDHTAIPGWSTDRLCVVYAITDRLESHRFTMRLVDFDAYLRSKAFYYNSIDNWRVANFADDGVTVGVTNGSAVCTFSGTGDWAAAAIGDILHLETTDNQWQGLIASLDIVGPTYSVTIESTGGELGPTLADIVTEGAIEDWYVLRSQKNRGSPAGQYAVLDDKYGCYGADDGFFRDDATAAYTYQR